jgi:hypothetical protein
MCNPMLERTREPTRERQARITRNEAAFRQTNEEIEALNTSGARATRFPIVCECGSENCAEVIMVAAEEYEAVRGDPHRFLIKPGHEAPDVEAVVDRRTDFVVVEKKPGLPQRLAEATDPRSEQGDVSPAVARRIAENEARFRDANERIEEAVLEHEITAFTMPFVCECGREACLKTLRLTLAEYELARQDPRFFLCIPGHEIVGAGVGRTVRETSKFVIVEKIDAAGAVAEERDPRRRNREALGAE